MIGIQKTAVPVGCSEWQFAQWDRDMAKMQARYRYYGNDPDGLLREVKRSPRHSAPDVPTVPLHDLAIDELGRIIEVGDADEQLSVPSASAVQVEELHEFRESTYVRHCRNRAGEVITEEAFQKGRAAREQLREDTLDIAFKLESAGRRAFADPKSPVAFIVCPETGRFHILPSVLGRKIFPTVAAAKRARLVAALELLLRTKEHKHDLFLTFSWGKRCLVGQLRDVFRALHRRLSKLNAEPFMKHFGAKFIFRASEIGSLTDDAGAEVRDDLGRILYHPHAHVLMHLERFLPRPQMAALTRKIGQFWGGAWWGIDGAIEKVREACKYTAKPADLRRLSGPELVALDDALFRLHLVQPLGALRDQIRARRESCLTVKRERRAVFADGKREMKTVPVVIPDWNARKRHRRPDPAAAERVKRRAERALLAASIKTAGVVFDGEREIQGDLFAKTRPAEPPVPPPEPQGDAKGRPVMRNRIVARLSPAPYFDRVVAPALLIWNFDAEGLEEIRNLPFVRPALEAVRERIAAARREAYRPARGQVSVHTSPVTVQPRLPALCRSDAWAPAGPPLVPAFAAY